MTKHPSTQIAVLVAVSVAVLLALWWAMGWYWSAVRLGGSVTSDPLPMRMQLTSSAFETGETIPVIYTCDGEQLSPPLLFDEVPAEAVSLALIMDDPDVPVSIREDQMWDHWMVWNIDPAVRSVAEGVEPDGIHGRTTSSTLKYFAPCPPDQQHRYYFYLYALDTKLALPEGSTKEELQAAMVGHVLDSAELMGTYQRP